MTACLFVLCLLYSLASIFLLNSIEAARILAVLPVPSISHQVVFRPILQELAKRGHEVTVITPDPAFPKGKSPSNLTEIDVHDISYKIWTENFMGTARGDKDGLLKQMHTIFHSINLVIDAQLRTDDVQKLIKSKQKFDLIIVEACCRPGLIFSVFFDAPMILMSSFGDIIDNYAAIGAPTHSILYPALTRQKLNNLTIWEKIWELYRNYLKDLLYENLKNDEYAILKPHYKDLKSMDELYDKVEMLFLNVYSVFEGIRPVPPSVIYMGGLPQKPDKELPQDLKSYLDSSKHGVIYLSFGTNVDPTLLPPERIQTLVKTFSKLRYDVLWKWNGDELPGRTNNIKISKWLPQSDLLKHPNVKLFITQGGLQSTDEAITGGVPLIGIPMLGDQWFNVERYETHKIGIRIDLDDLTEERLTNAINTIIADDNYRRNIIRLRKLMLDEPMKPLERAVWWIEYVIRHGGAKHLRSPAANITWAQYLELELVFTVLALLMIILTALILTLRFVYCLVMSNIVSVKIKRS